MSYTVLTRNREHIAKAKRVSKYDQIELKLREPSKPVIFSKEHARQHAIHDYKFPKDKRLTPLSQAQIDKDLYDLCLG